MKLSPTLVFVSLATCLLVAACGDDNGVSVPSSFTAGSLNGTYAINGSACADGNNQISEDKMLDKTVDAWKKSVRLNDTEEVKRVAALQANAINPGDAGVAGLKSSLVSKTNAEIIRESLGNVRATTIDGRRSLDNFWSALNDGADQDRYGRAADFTSTLATNQAKATNKKLAAKLEKELSDARKSLNAEDLTPAAKDRIASSIQARKTSYSEATEQEDIQSANYSTLLRIDGNSIVTERTNDASKCVQRFPGRLTYLENNAVRIESTVDQLATCSKECSNAEKEECNIYNAAAKAEKEVKDRQKINTDEFSAIHLSSSRTLQINRKDPKTKIVAVRLTNRTQQVRDASSLRDYRAAVAADPKEATCASADMPVGYVLEPVTEKK